MLFPWLMLFPKLDDEEENNATFVLLYNPDEDRVYKSKRDFSRIRFLANSGNWFLVIDSKFNLYIIDIFSEKRINLPPLESIQSSENVTIERLGDKKFKRVITCGRASTVRTLITDVLRGDLWVDEKTQDFIVVWFFDDTLVNCVCYCKKGDDRYTYIPKLSRVSDWLQNIYDVVLLGQRLYILTNRDFIRFIDLSAPREDFSLMPQIGEKFSLMPWAGEMTKLPLMNFISTTRGPRGGFRDVSWSNPLAAPFPCVLHAEELYADFTFIVVNESGEALLVESIVDKTTNERRRSFRVFKKDPDPYADEYYIEVDSLGDEAMLLGSRITVPGIEPNSIYFTSHDPVDRLWKPLDTEIFVFNLATKTLKRFPSLSSMKLKDARWFLPGI